MSECIISRRGAYDKNYVPEYGDEDLKNLKTEIITQNTIWTSPEYIKNNIISVRIFGGGGGGSSGDTSIGYQDLNAEGGCGGCGGYMNNAEIDILPNYQIQITIGAGGYQGTGWDYIAGGTTSFGTRLSANGGSTADSPIAGFYPAVRGGSSGGRMINGVNAFQFGTGGYPAPNVSAGPYGGGGASFADNNASMGGTYGGGGASMGYSNKLYAGSGGIYGGGGGGGICVSSGSLPGNISSGVNSIRGGNGGTYGGNGGQVSLEYSEVLGENGTNTIGWTNVEMMNGKYLTGKGIGGKGSVSLTGGGGGGGFGGCGGNGGSSARIIFNQITYYFYPGGGGGGYGGNGGNNGGGGGGFGGNGGDGYFNYSDNMDIYGFGGGGGYGPGADGGNGGYGSHGGGGGYFAKGGDGGKEPLVSTSYKIAGGSGGGGGYGKGGNGGTFINNNSSRVQIGENGGYGAGGGGSSGNHYNRYYQGGRGGSGICIIQYYTL